MCHAFRSARRSAGTCFQAALRSGPAPDLIELVALFELVRVLTPGSHVHRNRRNLVVRVGLLVIQLEQLVAFLSQMSRSPQAGATVWRLGKREDSKHPFMVREGSPLRDAEN